MNAFNLSGFESIQQMMQSALSQSGKNGNSDAAAAGGMDFSAILAGMTATEITVSVTTENPEPQTVEDVKKEFYAYLDSLELSPGLSKTPISVNITEAAFEKMLADPEYKQQMMDLCKRDLCDPAWNTYKALTGASVGSIVVRIDADVENEYIASSYGSAYGNKAEKAANREDSFWTRRTKAGKAAREENARRAREKQELLAFLQERAFQKKNGLDLEVGGFALAGISGGASFFAEIGSGGGGAGAAGL